MGHEVTIPEGVLIEIDGPGVSPDTVDASAALELAASYIELLLRAAKSAERELLLQGVKIIDKCAAIQVLTSDQHLARTMAQDVAPYLSGTEEPVYGMQTLVERAQKAAASLPPGQTARVIVGPWSQVILRPEAPSKMPQETLSLRATPIRVGGSRPAVRFESAYERAPFSLKTDEETAREIGARLYREADIVAVIHRDQEGHIEEGRLEEFLPLEDDDPRVAWKAWADEVGKDWRNIDDVMGELGRDRS